ncbi:MAG: hypothetical protein GC182_02950 [Rhodopseudomonas sp.]|nr:hypothetical protein [Rhodopseudomonas sp.]
MRKFLLMLAFASAVLVPAVASSSASAKGADATTVISACERDPHCTYGPAKDGTLQGCSLHACFECPPDGTHQCHPTRRTSKLRDRIGAFGGIKLSPGSSRNRHPVTVGTVKVRSFKADSFHASPVHANSAHSNAMSGGGMHHSGHRH